MVAETSSGWRLDHVTGRGLFVLLFLLQQGLLPLHEACLEGHTRIVHLLLAMGTDVNARTGVGVRYVLAVMSD